MAPAIAVYNDCVSRQYTAPDQCTDSAKPKPLRSRLHCDPRHPPADEDTPDAHPGGPAAGAPCRRHIFMRFVFTTVEAQFHFWDMFQSLFGDGLTEEE